MGILNIPSFGGPCRPSGFSTYSTHEPRKSSPKIRRLWEIAGRPAGNQGAVLRVAKGSHRASDRQNRPRIPTGKPRLGWREGWPAHELPVNWRWLFAAVQQQERSNPDGSARPTATAYCTDDGHALLTRVPTDRHQNRQAAGWHVSRDLHVKLQHAGYQARCLSTV